MIIYRNGAVLEPLGSGDQVDLGEILPPLLYTISAGAEGEEPAAQTILRIVNNSPWSLYSLSIWFESSEPRVLDSLLTWIYLSVDGTTWTKMGTYGYKGSPFVLDTPQGLIEGEFESNDYVDLYIKIQPVVDHADNGELDVIKVDVYDGIDPGFKTISCHIGALDYIPDEVD